MSRITLKLKEFATVALAQFDAKTRFTLNAAKGNKELGLKLLDKLDKNTL